MGSGCEGNNPEFGISVMDFDHNIFNINLDQNIENIKFGGSNVSICNQGGDIILYSSGNDIFNGSNVIIENGDLLFEDEPCFQKLTPQELLILPIHGSNSKFIVLSLMSRYFEEIGSHSTKDHYYSIVDLSLNNGLGKVTKRKEIFYNEYTIYTSLTSCKHANGRDWWIIRFLHNSNKYNKFLVKGETILDMGIDSIEFEVTSGLGQMHFSPDGSKLGMVNLNSPIIGKYIDVFDFDRCEGTLSNQRQVFTNLYAKAAGVSFSPDSRYFYVAYHEELWQFDTEAFNFENSKQVVGIYDGFVEYNVFASTFWMMQAGPDGKLYFTTSNGSHFMHVINDPNKRGLDCNFDQRGIESPTWIGLTIPNYPTYRLGPIDGSPCDTLGIDNYPVANYRYNRGEGLRVFFTDLSFYEPTSWLWEFGNNQKSSGQNPGHNYQQEGGYEVCLTVSNENGSDRYCEDICVKSGAPFLAEIPPSPEVLDCDNIPYDLEMFVLDIDSLGGGNSFSTQWSGPAGFQSTDRLTQVEDAGTYYVTITLDGLDCIIKDSVTFERTYLEGDLTYDQSDNTIFFSGNDSSNNHFWDFGDSNTSVLEDPKHIYQNTGTYTVTHIVSNECESDTNVINIQITVLDDTEIAIKEIQIFPNPTRDKIWIKGQGSGMIFKLFDPSGKMVLQQKLQPKQQPVSIAHLYEGIYFYKIEGLERAVGKLVIVR